jgi:NAD(P)H-hydrate epimerase
LDAYKTTAIRTLKISTAEQMREFDRRSVEEFGVPSIVLMENAGRHVADAVQELLRSSAGTKAVVVAGKGNNGGDGFVAARHLRDEGIDVSVFLIGNPSEVKGDARINLDILLKTGFSVRIIESASALRNDLMQSGVIVDAIFGTGLRGDVVGLPAEVIEEINASQRPVVSVDLPSGLDANTGKIWGICIKADRTATFALPKVGLVTYPGASNVGELIVGEIGIPHELYDEINVSLTGADWVSPRIPRRPPSSHKGTYGTAIVIAGSAGLTGAAAMAAESAMRVGVGLCTVCVPKSLQDLMAGKLTEAMTKGLPETPSRSIAPNALQPALRLCEKATAVVLGCGLSTDTGTQEFAREFVRSARKPLVLDADALNCLALNPDVLCGEHGELILTPHPGEMARLLGTTSDAIQSNRMEAAREAASKFHCVVVLKGSRTLIADESGRVFINPTGNAGLSTGGTGDVLSGAIGGLLAQGLSPYEAAVCGAFIHGMAGDAAASEIGMAGMIAGDVIRALPKTISNLQSLSFMER